MTTSTLDSTQKIIDALTSNNFTATAVHTKEEALELIKSLIPDGASIMNGASETLAEIGYIEYLKEGNHPWNNLHDAILAEPDPEKQGQLRRESVVSDYYVGSVHALTESGEIIISSNTGSQLPHLSFTSPNIILVVGKNKIVHNLADGFERLAQHVIPLEDERMKKEYGIGTTLTKTLILHKENPMFKRTVHVLIVDETLGF